MEAPIVNIQPSARFGSEGLDLGVGATERNLLPDIRSKVLHRLPTGFNRLWGF